MPIDSIRLAAHTEAINKREVCLLIAIGCRGLQLPDDIYAVHNHSRRDIRATCILLNLVHGMSTVLSQDTFPLLLQHGLDAPGEPLDPKDEGPL